MPKENIYKKVQMVLLIILIANLAVAALKIVIGMLIRSSSMTADGFHSLSDGSSNIVGMIGIHFASKPEDKEHPYGHNKIETMTGMVIGILLIAVAVKVIIEAVGKFQHPVVPTITTASLIALLVTLVINIFVTTFEHRKGVELNSPILISDATHTKSDIYVTVGVLTALVGIKLGLPPILDPIVSLVVAGFILRAAWTVLSENGNVLLDAALVDTESVRQAVLELPGVIDVHNIRSRGTPSQVFLDMHVLVDPTMNVEQSHDIEHKVEAIICEKVSPSAQVLCHVEPWSEEEAAEI